MDSKQLYLLKEVFKKVKKDELTDKYTIYKEDYIFLDLTEEMIQLLENMCKEYHIDLEKFPDKLSTNETYKLFQQYDYLKNYIKENQNDPNISSLKEEMIQIKQKIVLGHMKFMYLFLSSRFPNLIQEPDSEELYQTGYEFLLWSIDKYDINRGVPFDKYIQKIITNRLSEIIWKEKRNISINQARDIVSILPSIDKISEEEISKLDIREIKQQTGLCESRIKHLLSTVIKENETSSQDLPEYYLSEESFEDDLLNQLERENIAILVETLPETQKQVVKLYYGFIDGKRYKLEEIAKILGYNTRERVRQIREKALINLSLPAYRNAISSFSENVNNINNRSNQVGKVYRDKRQSELEDKIISTLPKEKLIELIEEFPPMYKDVLELYYGLIDGVNYNIKEISVILGKKRRYNKRKNKRGYKKSSYKNE